MTNGGDAISLHKQLTTDDDTQCLLNIKLNDTEEEDSKVALKLTLVEGQSEINFWRSKLHPSNVFSVGIF